MRVTRRRAMGVLAAAMVGGSAQAERERDVRTVRRFRALGAEARITLLGAPQRAGAALDACEAEIEGIEATFSLWRADSDLARLNAAGSLARPDPRLVDLAAHAHAMAGATGGAFDPTVQAVWLARARGGDEGTARALVDWRALSVTAARARFARPGMAATFNGIAQGYAADRVAGVLRAQGYRAALVNMGEYRALGSAPGRPWRLGVQDPVSGGIAAVLDVEGVAVATSEPRGTLIAGHAHIVDPLHRPGPHWRSVTVLAGQAWRADALSTAIAAAPVGQAEALLRAGGASRAVLIDAAGAVRDWRV